MTRGYGKSKKKWRDLTPACAFTSKAHFMNTKLDRIGWGIVSNRRDSARPYAAREKADANR
jgi:hypothetical protein